MSGHSLKITALAGNVDASYSLDFSTECFADPVNQSLQHTRGSFRGHSHIECLVSGTVLDLVGSINKSVSPAAQPEGCT